MQATYIYPSPGLVPIVPNLVTPLYLMPNVCDICPYIYLGNIITPFIYPSKKSNDPNIQLQIYISIKLPHLVPHQGNHSPGTVTGHGQSSAAAH
ncbi:hypothetical protein XENTR_v10000691 [Xenopus tropicalis]|nr:hypothetical protein XENTR_v10000691 [Xenopus tropicalis]